MALQEAPRDPIGAVTGLTVWHGRIVILDGIQANVKVFSQEGELLQTIGRARNGPGEFLKPFRAVELPDERLAVLDMFNLRVSFFDWKGAYDTAWVVQGTRPGGLAVYGETPRLVVAAENSAGADAATWVPLALHIHDLDGIRLSSLGEWPPPLNKHERAYRTVKVVGVGHTIVSAAPTDNLVHLYDTRTSEESWAQIGESVYQSPEWPGRPDVSIPQLMEWAKEQLWLGWHFALDSLHYVLAFTTGEPVGERRLRYAVGDVEGRTVAATGWTEATLHGGWEEGLVYGSEFEDDGSVDLIVYRAVLPSRALAARVQ